MSDTVIVALIAVIPSVIAAITTVITTISTNGKKRGQEIQKQIKESHDTLAGKIDNVETSLNEKIAQVEDGLNSRITQVETTLQNHIVIDNNNSKVLLRHNIDQMYDKFMAQGFITRKEMEEVKETYEAYAALGGNHIGEEKYKAIDGLPKVGDLT